MEFILYGVIIVLIFLFVVLYAGKHNKHAKLKREPEHALLSLDDS